MPSIAFFGDIERMYAYGPGREIAAVLLSGFAINW